MKVKNILDFIEKIAPFSLALSYDNVGLLVGDPENEVTKILFTLDITVDAVDSAIKNGCELIVSHHPVIFNPIKSVTAESVVYKLASNRISAICAHTNLDRAQGGVNDTLAALVGMKNIEILCPDDFEIIGRIGDIEPISVPDYVEKLKMILKTENISFYDSKKTIKRLAVISGGGGGDIHAAKAAGADALLTGEAKYNQLVDCINMGFSLIAAGHYETENPVLPVIAKKVSDEFPEIKAFIYER